MVLARHKTSHHRTIVFDCRMIGRRSGRISRVIGILLAIISVARAVDASGNWRDHVTFTLSERLRGEFVDWFRPPAGTAAASAHRYSFFASQLRIGVRVTFPQVQLTLEMQDTRLANLPDDASLASPIGNLGPGALYFFHTHDSSQGEPFLKQGYLTFRRSGLSASIGRFEYSDGLETVPADPTLAWLKRMRLGERLVGPFGYTHTTRSFDGARVTYDRPGWNATAFVSRPTAGGYEVSANREIDDVSLAGFTLTAKSLPKTPPADLRLFYLYYDDTRNSSLKVDNRPRPLRAADTEGIAVHTWGGHAVTVDPNLPP
jgi:hypothetical protein